MAVFKYLRNTFFIVLFAWISFFPQPIQDRYGIFVRIFLGIFLLILLLERKYLKYLFSFQDWPLWLFVICLSPNIFIATDKNLDLNTYLYLTITLIFLFYIGKGMYYSYQDINTVNIVICICSGFVASLAVFELIFSFNPLYEHFIENPFYERYISGWVRPMSTLFNPAPLASYLLLSLPFSIYGLTRKNLTNKICGFIVFVISVPCLILTFCRSSYLGLIFMLSLFLLITKKYKNILVIYFILLFLFSLPYPFSRLSPKGICIDGTGIFSAYRMNRLKMVFGMLKSSPLFGVGLNHFRILFEKYYPVKSDLSFIVYEIKIPDNMYLSLLAETGIGGFLGFSIFMTSLFKRAFKQFKDSKNENIKLILFVPVFSLIGLLLSMGGYELFYWTSPYMFFCLLCGFISGITEKTHKEF